MVTRCCRSYMGPSLDTRTGCLILFLSAMLLSPAAAFALHIPISIGVDVTVGALCGLTYNGPSAESVADVPIDIRTVSGIVIQKADVRTKGRLSIDVRAAPKVAVWPFYVSAGPELSLTVAHFPMRYIDDGRMNFSEGEAVYYEAKEKENLIRLTAEAGIQRKPSVRLGVGYKESFIRYRIESGDVKNSCEQCTSSGTRFYETYKNYDVGKGTKRTVYVRLGGGDEDWYGADLVFSYTKDPWPETFRWMGQDIAVKGKDRWGVNVLFRLSPALNIL